MPNPCRLLFVAAALSSLPLPALAQENERTDGGPPGALHIRYEYTGIKFADSTPEDCPDARTNGTETLIAELELVSADEEGYSYEGLGRAAADIDGCGLTPNREDPGFEQDRGQPGTFRGDNFLGCVVTTVVPEHDVRVSLEVSMEDSETVSVVRIDWEPVRPAVDVRVSAACEPEYAAGYITDNTEAYRDGGQLEISDYDLLPQMAPEGVLREGRYEEPWPGDYGAWTLTLGAGPPEEVRVAVEGPGCGCMNAEDAEGKPLRFTATASRAGGTFTPFEVRPAGQAPRTAANVGGAAPRLELVPAPDTGPVTLSIIYELDGRRYTAPDFSVSFCVMDSIEVKGGTRDLTFDASDVGRLEVPVASAARLNGADVSSRLKWYLERMPEPTRFAPGEATGPHVVLAYEGLPKHNRAFGKKTVTARLEDGGCVCEREQTVRTFFAPTAANHPPGDAGTGADRTGDPNWFYYWLQTRGAEGAVDLSRVRYQAYLPPENDANDNVAARYVPDTDRLFISDVVPTPTGCRGRVDPVTHAALGVQATGIDCFAETLRHEWQHRTDWLAWWPSGYSAWADGADIDTVPSALEEKEPGCNSWSDRSCAARPFPDVTDIEIYAYYTGWTWAIGSEDGSDWSCGGKQWGGGACPE